MLLQWTCLLTVVVSVMSHSPLDSGSHNTVALTFIKISKVMREGETTGRNHSTQVIISPHPPLRNVIEWKLLLQRPPPGDLVTLSLKVDGWIPSTQTEIVFEENLVESDSIFLQAKDSSRIVAMAYLGFHIRDLHSTVAWIGADKGSPSSSLRVAIGEQLGEVSVNGEVCKASDSPCYYITPNPKPTIVERCVSVSIGIDKIVKQCDDRETSFREMSPTPSLYLRDDGKMEVEFTYNQEAPKLEMVAYDPVNSTKVFSNSSYQCNIPASSKSTDGEKVTCLHDLFLPNDQMEIMVLLVQIDKEGYVLASNLQIFKGNPEKDQIGIIVGSAVGAIVLMAIFILVMLLFVKRKGSIRKEKKAAKRALEVTYTPAPTEPDSTSP